MQQVVLARKNGRRIGYTSGVFDLLHPGHVSYLEAAKQYVDLLVVGVNSDASVRSIKGIGRPICSEVDRAHVIAGLASVDFVFVFDEENNNRNAEIIVPDVYLKAGDYDEKGLSSAAIVEKAGGRVQIVPFESGHSTSRILERAVAAGGSIATSDATVLPESRPAIFVDRDGTIIEHVDYIHEADKVVVIPGAFEAIKNLRAAGYRIVMVTNQPGIGLGYFTKEDFFRVNSRLLKAATREGCEFDKIYFCPHAKSERCSCRKPATGMIDRAKRELNVDIAKSFVIGDMTLDLQLARNAGCRAVLVRTGRAADDATHDVVPDIDAADLLEASRQILTEKNQK